MCAVGGRAVARTAPQTVASFYVIRRTRCWLAGLLLLAGAAQSCALFAHYTLVACRLSIHRTNRHLLPIGFIGAHRAASLFRYFSCRCRPPLARPANGPSADANAHTTFRQTLRIICQCRHSGIVLTSGGRGVRSLQLVATDKRRAPAWRRGLATRPIGAAQRPAQRAHYQHEALASLRVAFQICLLIFTCTSAPCKTRASPDMISINMIHGPASDNYTATLAIVSQRH